MGRVEVGCQVGTETESVEERGVVCDAPHTRNNKFTVIHIIEWTYCIVDNKISKFINNDALIHIEII